MNHEKKKRELARHDGETRKTRTGRDPIDKEDAASYTFQPMDPGIRGLLRVHWWNFRKARRYKFAPGE